MGPSRENKARVSCPLPGIVDTTRSLNCTLRSLSKDGQKTTLTFYPIGLFSLPDVQKTRLRTPGMEAALAHESALLLRIRRCVPLQALTQAVSGKADDKSGAG